MESKMSKEPKTQVAPPKNTFPAVVSFGVRRHANKWHALVLKSRGREVVEERLIESDEYKPVVIAAMDRALHEFLIGGVDPFGPEVES